MTGLQRAAFEPYPVVPVGDVSLLDDLPKKIAKEKVRGLAAEIVDVEGPIHLDRLVRLIALAFDVRRLHAARSRKLQYQVRASGLQIDADKFVWPAAVDPTTWTEFRPSTSEIERPFEEISPVEIGNAAHVAGHLLATQSTDDLATDADLDTETLKTFGRARRTPRLSRHLHKAQVRLANSNAAADEIEAALEQLTDDVGLVLHRKGARLLAGRMHAVWNPARAQVVELRGYVLIPGSHHFDDLPYTVATWQTSPTGLTFTTIGDGARLVISRVPGRDRTPDLLERARTFAYSRGQATREVLGG